jgi:hypothetical protein
MNEYPKQIPHPNGFKTLTVYNGEQEEAVHRANGAWRIAHSEAMSAAREGRDLPMAPVDRTPTTRLSLNKGA